MNTGQVGSSHSVCEAQMIRIGAHVCGFRCVYFHRRVSYAEVAQGSNSAPASTPPDIQFPSETFRIVRTAVTIIPITFLRARTDAKRFQLRLYLHRSRGFHLSNLSPRASRQQHKQRHSSLSE